MAAPERLYFTGDDEADALIAQDPLALLIGFALDQQVTVQTAFAGPLKLQRRLGPLDAKAIAATDPAELEALFRQPPAIHRFPGSMAKRVHDLCDHIVTEYDGHAERVWTEAKDAKDLERRIRSMPGYGDMKVKAFGAVLAHGRNGDVERAAALVAEIAEAEPLWLPAFERYEALGLLPEGVVARARR